MKHEYRSEQGQVVYVEWPEDVIPLYEIDADGVKFALVPVVEEPQGLGAVVEAKYGDERVQYVRDHDGDWFVAGVGFYYSWNELKDPKVLSEGYTPEA